MNEQENKQVSHLIILISYTVFTIALLLESVLLGWEMKQSVEIAVGLIACWVPHIAGKVPVQVEKWMYFLLGMAGFAFYGSHLSSLYDLAPVMIMIVVVYYAAETYEMIRFCVAVYFAVLLYGLLYAFRGAFEFTPLSVSRLVLHGALVCLAAYLTKVMADQRNSEMKDVKVRLADMEEVNRRTEGFLTNVSHELRTPVNAVTGLAAVMLKSETDEGKRENLLSVQKAGYRLFGQIEDILDYTEIDAGKIVISEDSYMLSSLVNDIITEQYAIEEKAGVELIFDVEAKIPAVLYGDGRKIKKIIRHLVNNAVKFTEDGGVYVRVYALKKSYGLNLCIQVTDTGIGMDAESLSNITERFYQSSKGYDRRAGGLGLGLPIVYGMVAAMEGFVHVDSQLGKGTTVTVSIPQKIVDASPGMSVNDPAKLCLACYLMPEKYKVPEVRKFYDEMITHIAMGLDVTAHRVFKQDELERLVSTYRLTHLFLAREEYEKDPGYFENLDRDIVVTVVADSGFTPREGSRVKILPKPFYCFPIVSVLNSSASEVQDDDANKRLVCPGVRLLVVDDEPMNRMVAESIFKDYMMDVATVASGREAIEICQKEEFDLLFIDHMMPEMDGVETLKQLRRINGAQADTFIAVAFTANAVSGAREMFLREGFDDFLSKPIETTELERVLKKVLPKASIQYTDERGVVPQPAGNTTDQAVPAGAESSASDHADEDEIDALNRVGVNTASGLNYCRNDRSFYLQLLTKFAEDAPQKSKEIDKLYDEKNYGDYRIQVHSLKSSARMIGADALSQTAKEMEDAAKDSDAVYIKAHHGEFQKEYLETVRRIGEALHNGQSGDDASAPDGSGKLEPVTIEGLAANLLELKECLDTFEADRAQKILDKLRGMIYQEKPVGELIGDVEQDVADFELEKASDKVMALIRRMKGGEAE